MGLGGKGEGATSPSLIFYEQGVAARGRVESLPLGYGRVVGAGCWDGRCWGLYIYSGRAPGGGVGKRREGVKQKREEEARGGREGASGEGGAGSGELCSWVQSRDHL